MPHGSPDDVDTTVPADTRWRRIGRYRLLERLSRGPLTEVWRAEPDDADDDRVGGDRAVAVKWSGPDASDDARRRLRAEAGFLRAVRHPGIVELVELVDDEDTTAVVTHLVAGATLAERIADGPLGRDEVIRLGIGLCDALGALHDRGRVHGDVCPSNVIVGPGGDPVLIDVGVGANRVVEGTPGYVAPEVEAGEVPTASADLCGLGLTLVAALVGRDPPPIDTDTAIVSSGVSTSLAAALGSACAPDRRDRHPDVGELADALASSPERTDAGPATRDVPAAGLAPREAGRTRRFGDAAPERPRRRRAAMVVTVVLVVGALSWWVGGPRSSCPDAAMPDDPEPAPSGRALIDTDGDGCGEEVAWTAVPDGIVVTVGDAPPSEVTAAVAAVPGDIDCDGRADHLRTTERVVVGAPSTCPGAAPSTAPTSVSTPSGSAAGTADA
ncbi:MAG: serine/threonine-protein kinase [Actinomycetota bacterium]|nr:serine/threonine-protein kinase [Actinomycetota bacterium]